MLFSWYLWHLFVQSKVNTRKIANTILDVELFSTAMKVKAYGKNEDYRRSFISQNQMSYGVHQD